MGYSLNLPFFFPKKNNNNSKRTGNVAKASRRRFQVYTEKLG
jgi:hypothetical protein